MKTSLKSSAEKRAEQAENLSFCKGVKLLYIKENVEKLLACIGRNGIFDSYTLHDISHVDEMLKIVDWLIPDRTKSAMTAAEWLMLTLGIYFHDLGMVVTKQEYEDRGKSDFPQYKEEVLKRLGRLEYTHADDRFLYQEFVREKHAKRIRFWIEQNSSSELGDAKEAYGEIQEMLSHLDKLFKRDLGLIYESHHLDDIDDFTKYRTDAHYGTDKDEKVNLDYIAVILRIADLLHITRDRTPPISMRMFNVSNPVSILEWKKQQAVRAIVPKKPRNADGNIDGSLEEDTIEVTAYFDGSDKAEAYFGLSAYLKYVQSELIRCNGITAKAKKTEATTDYDFPWQKIDESQITANGFETKKLQFVLDQENILQMLVGHTLYNDSSVVVRELAQNAIDAVRLQKEYDKKAPSKGKTPGRVSIKWDSDLRTLSFTDNGTGMTISDIENYLLKVGASKYQDSEIKKEFPDFSSISHFGIGILTCFMVADSIDVTTSSPNQEQATIVNLRNLNGNYLVRKVSKSGLIPAIRDHGTTVTLHLRNDVDMSNLAYDLRKWIVVPEVPVYLQEDDQEEIRIGYDSLADILKEFLAHMGIEADGVNYTIYQAASGNVTTAFAVRYSNYLCDWELISTPRRYLEQDSKEELLPIGTCIEGVRVEFTTPGYKQSHLLAIANIKGSKYKTNVARSAIELEGNREFLADIYSGYRQYLRDQIVCLRSSNYSDSWALSECSFLMSSLLNSGYDRIQPIDGDVLVQNFANLDCLIIENQGQRQCASAEYVSRLDEINLFDCAMLNAIEWLFREIRSSASLESILNVVCKEGNFLGDAKNILCNYAPENRLHQYALKDKEVSYIKVDRNHRRIQLTYSRHINRWNKYERTYAHLQRHVQVGNYNKCLFIPIGSFSIEGLDNEIGVQVMNNIYLKSDAELCQYIIKTLEKISVHKQAEILTELFIDCVSHPSILSTAYSEDAQVSLIKNMIGDSESLWTVVDREEFSNIVLAKTHLLYSINNWSRPAKEFD